MQIIDHYYEMLKRGIVPPLDTLLSLCPDEPLGPPEGYVTVNIPGVGKARHARTHWPEQQQLLAVMFPGYQPKYKYRHPIQFEDQPGEIAPLAEFIRFVIKIAKADWSLELNKGKTALQFREWLPLYLNEETVSPPLCYEDKGWSEAIQMLRLACGLPRFAPSSKTGGN